MSVDSTSASSLRGSHHCTTTLDLGVDGTGVALPVRSGVCSGGAGGPGVEDSESVDTGWLPASESPAAMAAISTRNWRRLIEGFIATYLR
jgi:hypothetical protein